MPPAPLRYSCDTWMQISLGYFHIHIHIRWGACDASSGPEFGIKCQKVTRRVASTRKLCNILLNVSISVTLLLIWPKLSPFFRQVSFAVLGPRMPRRQGSHSNRNNTNNSNIERNQQSDNNDRRRWQVAARLDSVVLA